MMDNEFKFKIDGDKGYRAWMEVAPDVINIADAYDAV